MAALTAAVALLLGASSGWADEPTQNAVASSDATGTPSSSTSSAARSQQARALHRRARALYVQGRYREAIDALERALTLDPQGKDLHYITAFVAEKLGDLDRAIEHYQVCASLEQDPEERRRLEHILARVRGARASGALLRPSAVAPVSAPATPGRTARAGGEIGPWPWVTAAGAGGALLVGGALAIHAAATDPGPSPTSAPGRSVEQLQDEADAAHRSAVAADVAFALAGAAAAATLVLVIVGEVRGERDAAGAHAIRPRAPLVAGLAWEVRGP